ncbi:MAG: MlaD family protein [Candidatus Margulisbacteria bacterium]|nr:MlaD family protein [Candidatus Margulisiibacteriota bacterium]
MKKETKVGFFVFVAMVILVTGIIWKSNLMLQANGYMIIGSFKTVSGLLTGAEVRYRGYSIGNVNKITPGPKEIRVYMFIQKNINIPEGSRLRIDFDGLIGEKYVNVLPNPNSMNFIHYGAILPGYAASGIVDFVDAGTENLMETKKILEVLSKIITSEDSQSSIQGLIINLNKISQRLDSVMTKVDTLFEQKNVQNVGQNISDILVGIKRVVTNVDQLVSKLSGSVDKQDVKAIVSNLKSVSGKMNDLTDSFSKDKDKLLQDLQPVIQGSKEIVEQTKGFTKSLNNSTSFFQQTSVNLQAQVLNNSTYEVGSQVSVGDSSLKFDWGTQANDPNLKAKNLTFGKKIMDKVKASIGLVNFYPGVKVDVKVNDSLSLENELYNPNNVGYTLKAYYYLVPNIKAILGLDQNQQNSTFTWGLGVDSY